jgi:hypothetical protein
VDYVLANGFKDTVAYWEMDNERWDMPGADYAKTVAAHVRMLHAKIQDAKVIVCIDAPGSFSPNLEGTHTMIWNRQLLAELNQQQMAGQIECFAPHEYPFLKDKSDEIVENYLEDWSIRNVYRDLDYAAAMLDANGFNGSKLYATEWGFQSDILCCEQARNDLNTSMAAALSAGKTMMALYSHPRVVGATLHPFLHVSMVNRETRAPFSKWGGQTIFFTPEGRQITTPPLQAVKMFVQFARGATLVPVEMELPKGVHCLCAREQGGLRYFVVNSTSASVKFPRPVSGRSSLFSRNVQDSSIVRYGSYGDMPGDIKEIVPQGFPDGVIPPYSINVLR